MKISIIVPVYNDSRVESCISSLLTQDYPKDLYEVIVVDNKSDAFISEIIQRFPVTYVREESKGSYFARNRGLQAASGEIVAFIDADCVADPSWLKNLLKGFEDPEVGGVGGQILKLATKTWVQDAAEDLANQQTSPQSLAFLPYSYIVTANAAYRTDVLKKVQGFDTQFQSGGDIDLSWRVQLAGYKIITVGDALVFHENRESIKSYFRQQFIYAVGHTLLFKKYRHMIGKKVLINTSALRSLMMIPRSLIFRRSLWLASGTSATTRGISFLSLVKYAAVVYGNLYGSIKHRVLLIVSLLYVAV